ncbi:hypothetical protein [Teichococcus aestuarii]|uniref:Uncharacterized protein n=1 Tax=Teichococcus aestuarii TaxID=568898 RepID=A0A2U1VA25_9PROT|nr:hypothetical protein [Pseudoroseomonas aestuarii]PWC30772.1 hypothetical protein CR165_02405 [Pseudoroseomonas aestuarii]
MSPDISAEPANRSLADRSELPSRGDWQKVQRPAYHSEEGEGDRSDWTTLFKSALVVMLGVAGLTAFLSGVMAQ